MSGIVSEKGSVFSLPSFTPAREPEHLAERSRFSNGVSNNPGETCCQPGMGTTMSSFGPMPRMEWIRGPVRPIALSRIAKERKERLLVSGLLVDSAEVVGLLLEVC